MPSDEQGRSKLSGDEIADRALPLSKIILDRLSTESPDLLTAIAALEAAKLSLMRMGVQAFGDGFAQQATRLLESFGGWDTALDAMEKGAFFQGGGNA